MTTATANLCSERHFMGSAARGRFATDASERTPFWHPPYPEVVAQLKASKTACRTRYLRNAGVLQLVDQYEDAKAALVACDAELEGLDRSAPGAAVLADSLLCERQSLIDLRREASRQLRLIGISPQEQAQIRDEILRRTGEADPASDSNRAAVL